MRSETSKLKLKVLESGQSIRKEFDGKDHESRKTILKLNEEISELNLQLNEEKSRNSRIGSETTRYKTEKLRLEEFCDEMREKDSRNQDTIQTLKNKIQSLIEEIEQGKAENRMLQLRYLLFNV